MYGDASFPEMGIGARNVLNNNYSYKYYGGGYYYSGIQQETGGSRLSEQEETIRLSGINWANRRILEREPSGGGDAYATVQNWMSIDTTNNKGSFRFEVKNGLGEASSSRRFAIELGDGDLGDTVIDSAFVVTETTYGNVKLETIKG